MKPLNPESPGVLVLDYLTIVHADEADTFLEQLADLEENQVVTLKWSNAEVVARAGTIRAWIESGAPV